MSTEFPLLETKLVTVYAEESSAKLDLYEYNKITGETKTIISNRYTEDIQELIEKLQYILSLNIILNRSEKV